MGLPVLRPVFSLICALVVTAGPLDAQTGATPLAKKDGFTTDAGLPLRPGINVYGVPGLIDMPSGFALPDGELTTTVSYVGGITRGTLSFQVHPRISGSFRYSGFEDYNSDGSTFFDRSFDLRLLLLEESQFVPALTVGLQDFVGTGLFSGEYIVASKSFGRGISLTAGLGWGRLGSDGAIGSTGSRPERDFDLGGEPEPEVWFRGDFAPFGGIQWDATPRLSFKAELSSDAYDNESNRGVLDPDTPFNFGVEYQLTPDIRLAGYSAYGTEIGAAIQVSINPARTPNPGSFDPAPPPVLVRPSRAARPELYTTDWVASQEVRDQVETLLVEALREERMDLEALSLTSETATVYLRNGGYRSQAQALGRTLRVMSRVMPSSIETFTVVQSVRGLQLPSVTYARRDVETFEVQPDGAEQMLARRAVDQAPPAPQSFEFAPGRYPDVDWFIGPYVLTSFFDPDEPIRADLGVQVGGGIEVAPGLVFRTNLRQGLIGNLDEIERRSNSVLPRVRSDFAEYAENGDPWIENLYGAQYFQPGGAFYGRVTAGILERMHSGVSTELLWAPYDRDYALGAELNYTRQRDFEGGFGLQDYDVVTGHVSLYWRFLPQYQGQIDVGRYLAGDEGATFGLQRVFENGWRVGAFATFTNVSSEDFGEGSFDKGITMTIPFDWLLGRSTRKGLSFALRPVTRDGGARLAVPGRLFGLVDQGRAVRQEEQWGRFWR